jgi:hypothetical protein
VASSTSSSPDSFLRAHLLPKADRPICGARTQSGAPCRGRGVHGRKRCKWHGGCSTGPRTLAGKARALANLKQFRRAPASAPAPALPAPIRIPEAV